MNLPVRTVSVGVLFGVAFATGCVAEPHQYSAEDAGDDASVAHLADAAANSAVVPGASADAEAPATTSKPDAALAADGGGVTDAATPACKIDAECDDGNPCNGAESCHSGGCAAAEAVEDGFDCSSKTEARVCVLGNCIASRCGDGLLDPAGDEDCDDSNEVSNDGCESNCKFSCSVAEDCPAGPFCAGAPACEAALHVCTVGVPEEDLTECGDGLVCVSATCVPEGCGNSEVEEGEECDDGNTVLNDGCDHCTYTCHQDSDCNNLDVCDGEETCDTELHVCLSGEPLICNDQDECTVDSCDVTLGCVTVAVDEDGDGHAPEAGGCGDDCDDSDETAYTGAPELCDQKDNNCDTQEDETALNWYKDCDGDGYAVIGSNPVSGCNEPAAPTDCEAGLAARWTTRVPSSAGESDCWDKDPSVHPRTAEDNNQAWSSSGISGRAIGEDYDYNCYSGNEKRYTATGYSSGDSCAKLQIILQPVGSTVASTLDNLDWLTTPALDISKPIIRPTPVACIGGSGWTGANPPACGAGASYSTCSGATGSCVRSASVVTQQCR
jgi:cysteine-rich repeat protein